MEKQESEIKNKEKEPKIYCCFSNNENGVEQVLGLAREFDTFKHMFLDVSIIHA